MNSHEAADDMGPAAFMWPADRVWSAAADNTAPCGSVAGVGNRTEFPLKNGAAALVGQDESYDIELSISYSNSPSSNSDFDTLIDAKAFRELDTGHTCVPVPDAASSVSAGDNATLQIKYISDMEGPKNETFYACADITYVEAAIFEQDTIPCFNATIPESDGDSDNDSDDNSDDDEEKSGSNKKSGSSSALSAGAIAGIVVGSLAGVGVAVVAAVLVYRRKKQQGRQQRQERTARGVKWEEQNRKTSASESSVRMQNL